MKRFLSLDPQQMAYLSPEDLFTSLKLSEGRIVVSEMLATHALIPDCTNAEIARAFAADLMLLNLLDVTNPKVKNLPLSSSPISDLKKLCPRPFGVNLEPSELVEAGRMASSQNFMLAQQLGFDFVSITGNPATGVSLEGIIQAVKVAKQHFQGLVFAGKMHGAGEIEDLCDTSGIEQLLDAGTDVVMLPAPYTVPASTPECAREAVSLIHKKGKMAMATIGTSQETANQATIAQIALASKSAGFDLYHIGDAGVGGIAPPENIQILSDTIRGNRHSLKMMATSINR
ncbi:MULTISPECIES: haloacid dehalogenase-like hydrolase [Pasteurellaceae]|uniref:Haloacid dehalogenase-like hydrolase n=1 Tax=Pasteurella atlantica TaxID=2827233 RepID=A0AAW8CQ20_9PAST|nr:haloacid dehalogenase-like hydrolase [Pasteurella atlantica]MBR0573774.1 haloacid dehalogenase-like hydrolase [Pasteurella atlantica]MDP8039710.1 haloacid dehalogenase-like hydrolase [Pasteurella atlantica]MDP8041895.1 haloacid dehalogenase-like hydrolase [Pasteurella atlantica]MDP8044080.1 haloacid dehalogenase-like hydrolase [Pasteurella atlantica]MDP8046058.1 haloacid dehalogenase-like hydrolase [Pasteurella atlantica]